MLRYFSLAVLLALLTAGVLPAQESEPPQPLDSAKTDSVTPPPVKSRLQQAIEAGERAAEEVGTDSVRSDPASTGRIALEKAQKWVRRLFYRGWLNPTVIGGFSTYQLTFWGEGTGSYGPVDAKLTVQYLGPTEWMGKDAEWLQAAYYTMESDPELIEFDLIVPARQKITEVYRALYRIDRGELQAMTFGLPAGQIDMDAVDRPLEAGQKSVKVYAGTFDCATYRGTGDVGAEVIVSRSSDVMPLEIVVLGYGDEGLTFSANGANVTPRFKSPPPLSR
ncbi:hypothetical protein HZB60_08210 [candidate division KSB1 bacterium]|nr:hypothetical protein [candidate division KSB1 bacterium]